MAAWLAERGPISVAVNAASWQSYTGGVLTAATCGAFMVNHGVLIVAYNKEQQYWTIKNSWNSDWGEAGYVRLKFGTNTCAITRDPSASWLSTSSAIVA